MAIRKFGTGEVTGVDGQDPQGLTKEALSVPQADEWTEADAEALAEENEQ